MGINSESDIAANLQIGPTTLGMVRIYVEGAGIDLPLDFDPDEADEIAEEIKKHIPDFEIEYDPDPVRQAIADSWPDRLDDQAARDELGWEHQYDLARMVEDMLENLSP